MIKRIFILSVLIVFSAYLLMAVTTFNSKPVQEVCKGMTLAIKDTVDYGFINYQAIHDLFKKKGVEPTGKPLNEVNVRQLEDLLDGNPFIADAECYLTSGGKVAVHVYQRIPVMRIMSANGDDYYLDYNGQVMYTKGKPVHVPVATGLIDRKFARDTLYPLARYLYTDAFWRAQIEQVNVTSAQELELVPRVGDHILFLGKPSDYQEKFRKLQTFYQQALNQVGWNKYSRISIEFNNQIICTKKGM